MKILEVGDFNDPYRRIAFTVKGDVARWWEERHDHLPEVVATVGGLRGCCRKLVAAATA
jgi:hypothetical protein